MTANERLKKIRNDLGLSQTEFASKLGMKQGGYSDVERGRFNVSAAILLALQETFKVNPGWIRSGEGDVFTEAVAKIPGRDVSDDSLTGGTIKYYDLEATASMTKVFEAGDKYHPREITVPGFSDCELAMNVWGDSMEPEFHSGEIILLKSWNETFIEYGQVYLVVTKTDHRMLKTIYPGESDETIKCVSKNELYPPVEVRKENIYKIYLVKGRISRSAI